MIQYGPEFLKLAVAHLLALVSPGPDFAIVVRQGLHHGRRAAIVTAIGIGSGICLHVGYSLLGVGILVRSSAPAFEILKFAGAGYLAWIGIQSLRTARTPTGGLPPDPGRGREAAGRSAWFRGFMTNALNPKATLFFVAVFASIVDPRTPWLVRSGYGLWITLTTTAWFIVVATVFAREPVRRAFILHRHWIDRAMGVVFLGFAAALVFASV
jgi:RhtB (resistance to homoserine/threonine) family protein